MIIALKKNIRKEEQENLIRWLESYGVRIHLSEGEYQTVIGLVGDTTRIDTDLISGLDIVDNVTRISEPFKKANRKFHPEDSVITVAEGVAFGRDSSSSSPGPVPWRARSRWRPSRGRFRPAGPGCSAAALSNRALPPMIFRDSMRRESAS